ncbi:MAG: FIST signal transduction protein [Gaiellaceae bacterium]
MFSARRTTIRHDIAGSASAAGKHACRDAVEGAIADLGQEAGLVLIFTAGEIDAAAAAAEAKAAAGAAHVAGMGGTGTIGAPGLLKAGCSAMAFSASLWSGVGVVEAGDSRAAGRDATAEALAAIDDAPHGVVLLFVDSESGDQSEFVAGAYTVAGGRIPLAGGAAGGAARARFADGRALSSGIVAVAIGSTAPIGVGVAHGCVARGAPSIVTRSEGPNVLELDGRPADVVYFEKLGVDAVDLSDEEFDALAMVHPVAEPELSGAVRPRYVRARARDGGLVCATAIERNAAVVVCDQTPETIVESARVAAADAVSQLDGAAEAAVVFDCAARSAWFCGPVAAALAERELESMAAGFGEPVPSLAGAYTRGEIGRARGAKGDRNHSVVVTAFGAPD